MAPIHKKSHLSPAQKLAILALASGATDEEAAAAAKVCRETVTRWRNGNLHFHAALNKLLLEVWEGHKMKLLGAVSDAVQTITAAVKNNPAVAMRLLEKCRGLNEIEPPRGATSAEDILLQLAGERAQEELTEIRRKESNGQLVIIDPIRDTEELSGLVTKHFSILKEKHQVK